MAHNNYLSKPGNPFFSVDDEDVDDDAFLQNSRQVQKMKDIGDRAIRSTHASIGILRDTEEIGVRTAEELLRQREQLENTEKKLDDINNTLSYSQRHIQGIKSVFGSFKNYLSRRQDLPPPSSSTSTSVSSGDSSSSNPEKSSKLSAVLENPSRPPSVHPGLKIRGLSDEREEEELPSPSGSMSAAGRYYRQVDEVLDRNIDEIGDSLSRLKGLARGLGDEIESQNDVLDRVYDKTDRASLQINRQNRDMTRIMKK